MNATKEEIRAVHNKTKAVQFFSMKQLQTMGRDADGSYGGWVPEAEVDSSGTFSTLDYIDKTGRAPGTNFDPKTANVDEPVDNLVQHVINHPNDRSARVGNFNGIDAVEAQTNLSNVGLMFPGTQGFSSDIPVITDKSTRNAGQATNPQPAAQTGQVQANAGINQGNGEIEGNEDETDDFEGDDVTPGQEPVSDAPTYPGQTGSEATGIGQGEGQTQAQNGGEVGKIGGEVETGNQNPTGSNQNPTGEGSDQTEVDTRTPAQKRADTIAANKAASDPEKIAKN